MYVCMQCDLRKVGYIHTTDFFREDRRDLSRQVRKLINYITRLNMKATGLFTIQIYSLSIQQLSTGLLTFLHALALKRV